MIQIFEHSEDAFDRYQVRIYKDGLYYEGEGLSIITAYDNALIDPCPSKLIHTCKTEEELYNLKQTNPELFI